MLIGGNLMNKYYPNLLSPLKVRNKFYKNRMGFPRAVPTIASGIHIDSPIESLGLYLGGVAKNGAAVVTVNSPVWKNPLSRPMPEGMRGPFNDKGYDMNLLNVQLEYTRVIEAIHNYGSLACISLMQLEPNGWTINDLTPEVIEGMASMFAEKCVLYKSLGFDQCCFYMSYGGSMLAKSLSPIANKRTDKYGGSTMAERSALAHEIFSRVRAACGPDFILEAQVSGEEHNGYTINDLCEFARACEDVIDVFQVRAADGSLAHPMGINFVEGKPITLKYAEALKRSGTSILIAPVGGYQDPDLNEKLIAEGKADFIYMARAFICDSEYGRKIAEGHKEDIVPCVFCNGCHIRPGDPDGGCVVNPRMVLSLDHNFKVDPPLSVKKVAVIGGGPAGMEAALVASQRGHRVTLYEKAAVLGGQLIHADYSSFKWPMRNFKNYLIRQVEKSAIDVRLGAAATPELLKDENYDAIILAAGAKHKLPNIPGVEGKHVRNPLAVYGHQAELGKKVVVIGGSQTGVETGLYLAMNSHDVTILTRQDKIAYDAQRVHFREIFEEKWKTLDNFKSIAKARTTAISKDSVTYTDADGKSHTIAADSVVACGGLASCQESALEFAAITDYFRIIGDCRSPKDVKTAMKSAYTSASGL